MISRDQGRDLLSEKTGNKWTISPGMCPISAFEGAGKLFGACGLPCVEGMPDPVQG